MPWVWDRFPVFWALAQKISQFYITYNIEITCHYMATWSVQKLWIRAVARWEILGKTLKVKLLQTCFVIEDFGSNRTGVAIGNAWWLLVLKVRRDFILDGLLIQNVANIQSVNAFIGEFDIQKRAVPCFCRFTDPDSFEKPVWRNIQNNTLKSMSGRSNVSKMQGQGGLVQGV